MKITQLCLAVLLSLPLVRAGGLRQLQTDQELEPMNTCGIFDEEVEVSDACQDLVSCDDDLPEGDDNNRKLLLYSCPSAPYFDAPSISFLESDPINGSANDRVWFSIDNYSSIPQWLFNPTSILGPCGKNTNPARTWVHFDTWENGKAKRLYGYCALTGGLPEKLWVALDRSEGHWIRMRIHDRYFGSCSRSTRYSKWVWLPAQ